MTLFPYQHSFASQRLYDSGIQIFAGKKRILTPPPIRIFDGILQTKIVVGAKLIEEESAIKTLTYDDVLRFGYIISVRRAKYKRFSGQKVEYYMARSTTANDYGCIPPDHRVEYDAINKKVRVIGENCDGQWIFLSPQQHTEMAVLSDKRYYQEYLKTIMPYNSIKERAEEIDIPEIPILISVDGRLICIKETRDNLIMCMAGSKGKGKTLMECRILGQATAKWKKRGINLNDPQQETAPWCLTWEGYKWKELDKLNQIGEISAPLPMVYLHPKTKSSTPPIHPEEVGFEISLPFKECMTNYNYTFAGTNKQLQKSLMYLKGLIFDDEGNIKADGLISKKTFKEQSEIINTHISDKREDVKEALKLVLGDFSREQIFDTTNKVPSKWKVVFPDGNECETYPWTACAMADLVPSFITTDLRTQDTFPLWMRFVLRDIFQNQSSNEYYKKNKIETFLMIDEAQRLFEDQIMCETISQIAREARASRISMCYVPQNLNKVPDDLALVTDYILAFNCNKEQASSLFDNFGGIEYQKKDLTKLKPFYATLFTKTKYKWYDIFGEHGEDDAPITGQIIPPNARHMPPKTMKEEE